MNIRKLASQDDLVIRQVVLDMAQKKGQTIHGARAINEQIPAYLRKKTKDYDIFTKNPKKSAHALANELRRRLNGDIKVVKGSHKGTFRVKKGDENIVDYSQSRRPIKSKNILGIKYKDIGTIKKGTQKLVKRQSTEFRREKDLSTLQRIQELERIEQSIKF